MKKRYLIYASAIALVMSATPMTLVAAGKSVSYEQSRKQQDKQRAEATKQLKKVSKEKDKLEKQIRDASEELTELVQRYQEEGYQNNKTKKKIDKTAQRIRDLGGKLTGVNSKYQLYSQMVYGSSNSTGSFHHYDDSTRPQNNWTYQEEARLWTEEARREAEQARIEARREAEQVRREAEQVRREAEQARREAEQAQREARREAEQARREARQQAEDARRQAQESRREAQEVRRQAQEARRQAQETRRQAERVSPQEWITEFERLNPGVVDDKELSFFEYYDPALERILSDLQYDSSDKFAIINRRQAYNGETLELDIYIGSDYLKNLKNVILRTKFGDVKVKKWKTKMIPCDKFKYLVGIIVIFDTELIRLGKEAEPYRLELIFDNDTIIDDIDPFMRPIYDPNSWDKPRRSTDTIITGPSKESTIIIDSETGKAYRYDSKNKKKTQGIKLNPNRNSQKSTENSTGNTTVPTDPMKF